MYTKLKDAVRLYFHYIAIALRSTMQYKVSFFLMVTGRFLVSFNGILGVYFMLSRFGHVKGYTFGEVLLCFSIIQMDFALAECIGGGFAMFSGIVRQGEFDRILLRPHSAVLQVLGSKFRIDRIGLILQALAMFLYGIIVSPAAHRLFVRRGLRRRGQNQKGGRQHVHHHPLPCGHRGRSDRRTGKQRAVFLIDHIVDHIDLRAGEDLRLC